MNTIDDGLYAIYAKTSGNDQKCSAVPKLIPSAPPGDTFHTFWRDRPLFRGGKRLFLGQPGDAMAAQDGDSRRHDRPRHRRRLGGLRHQWRDARLEGLRVLTPISAGLSPKTATAWCWAKAPACSCWRPRTSPARAAPRPLAVPRLWHRPRCARSGSARRGLGRHLHDHGARQRAGLAPADIDYVNAHGTASVADDVTEAKGLNIALGAHCDHLLVSSTKKPVHGHAGGRAGIGTFHHGLAPTMRAIYNTEIQDPNCRRIVWSVRKR